MKGARVIELVFEFLQQRPEQKFFTRKIAEWIFENYEAECREIQEKSRATVVPVTDDPAIIGEVIARISGNRNDIKTKHPQIKISKIGRKLEFYYTESIDNTENQPARLEQTAHTPRLADNKERITLTEHDLYQKLSDYLFSEDPKIYTKRIDEKRSKNLRGSGGNKWLYPDVVGVEVLNQSWVREIKECVKAYSDKKTKLWSFEVKLKINQSNVR